MRNFAPFLLILFVIAALLRVDFFFTVIYFFFAVYLLPRLWTPRAVKHTRIKRSFVKRAFLGDRVTVDLMVHNDDWLPVPWLEVHESLPLQLSTPPFHRGVISLGPR
ncbi:MAG: hypothetical protein SVX38_16745, partial [Chloroflexota bacterium]|nr:hypothetical protein [Chloroflexota bacterium]